jgi:peptidoglycan/LPS O-acetylase OafA/YrhL
MTGRRPRPSPALDATSVNYRSDIDGLRAVAVLSVVAYHLSFSFPHHSRLVAPGGFVGVDVFFVISGYLITRTIYEDVDRGTYSVIGFYNRRVRRIFPALFAVLLFIFCWAFFRDLPSELSQFTPSLVSAIFFVSNILFYNSSGYFDHPLQANPLLHTWSLSIEEQFYIVFPILVLALRGVNHSARAAVMLFLCVASLAYATREVGVDQAAAFYLAPSRAWELLLGSVLAIGILPRPQARRRIELLSALGLGLILGSVEVITPTTPFPGLTALAPCLGAAAILYAGGPDETYTGRLLSRPVLRFLGLISYSLYLWHWPLIVFFRTFREPTDLERLGLLYLSIAVAYLSWRYVEQPFRQRPYRFSPNATVASAAGAMACAAALAFLAAPASRLIWPRVVEAERLAAYQNYGQDQMRQGTCFLVASMSQPFELYDRNTCLGIVADKKNVLIVGDSHAAHLWLGLHTVFKDINFLQATSSGCLPLFPIGGSERCKRLMEFVLTTFLPRTHLDGIILSANWNEVDLERVQSTAMTLERYTDRLYVFGPIVAYDRPLPRILAAAVGSDGRAAAEKHLDPLRIETDRAFAAGLSGDPTSSDAVRYVSVYRALCHPQCAVWAKEGVPLQFDSAHLTGEGSIYLASQLDPALFK